MQELFTQIVGSNPIIQGLAGGIFIAFLNMIGALGVLVIRNPSQKLLDTALGGAAGVMLAASFTSLILPGIEMGGIVPVLIGLALGTIFLDRADAWVPHVHVLITGRIREEGGTEKASTEEGKGINSQRLGGLILFIVAITLHNMPEGLAVGVSFGTGDLGNAISLMLAIGIQNIPEGLAVAVAARNAGLGSLSYAAFTGIRAGLVELPIAVFGAAVVSIAEPLVPYAMGFAAGAMLYVISDEIIPETHANGNERIATLGLMAGLIIMLTLDVVLA
ncbi:MAG TPA: ZIP family metal transporter [Balneolaceae bacterium]|nr:ZIP family metal transporter [Balneolaceae bacterium]